jgi:hypothetical protein
MSPDLKCIRGAIRTLDQRRMDRIIFIGQASLRRAIAEYMDHYRRERNHQGLEKRLSHASAVVAANDGATIPLATGWNATLLLPQSRMNFVRSSG